MRSGSFRGTVTTIFCVIVLFLVCREINGEERSLKKVSFIPHWTMQAQFAGYYVALEKGIYERYGIDATILNGGPDRSPCDLLESRKVDFATMGLNSGIQHRAQGLRFVNIGQIVQKSALMFVAKKSSGIREIKDINGRKVGVWTGISSIQSTGFIKKYGLSVEVIPQSYTVNLFLRDGVDVASAMWYNEYHTILNSGYDPDELTTFFFSEHDLNFPEGGIYALEETFEKDPALCRDFVKASLEGWKYAFEHPEETVDIMLRYMEEAHVPANRVHQRWMLDRMRDLMLIDDRGEITERLSVDDYYRVADLLKENNMIERIPELGSFYKGCGPDDASVSKGQNSF